MSAAPTTNELTGKEPCPVAPSLVLASKPLGQRVMQFSRFQLSHVSQSAAVVTSGDVCRETCQTPPPTTCKLECHSGAPFTDLQEDVPEAVY
ncbi:MAG TPA: hypothetical protein VFV38_48275 [Ktedonobacteraceae bacterium]|nr:hypothetical protein [Ktedonobacteraceae bacterium]